MKRQTKKELKHRIKNAKSRHKKEIKNILTQYKNSGDNTIDIINSIYVRKIYYKVTWQNIKRDGLFKFFWGKFLAERRYYYYTSLGRPANLTAPKFKLPISAYNDDSFNVQTFSNHILEELNRVGEELIKTEAKIEQNAKTAKENRTRS